MIENNEQLMAEGKAMRIRSIVGIVTLCTLIFFFVTIVLNIIDAVKILSTDWKNKELDDSKVLWGILTLLLLSSIASLVFSNKIMNEARALESSMDQMQFEQNEVAKTHVEENPKLK